MTYQLLSEWVQREEGEGTDCPLLLYFLVPSHHIDLNTGYNWLRISFLPILLVGENVESKKRVTVTTSTTTSTAIRTFLLEELNCPADIFSFLVWKGRFRGRDFLIQESSEIEQMAFSQLEPCTEQRKRVNWKERAFRPRDGFEPRGLKREKAAALPVYHLLIPFCQKRSFLASFQFTFNQFNLGSDQMRRIEKDQKTQSTQ